MTRSKSSVLMSCAMASAFTCSVTAAMAAPTYRIDPSPREGSLVPEFAGAINDHGDSAGVVHDRDSNRYFGYRITDGNLTKLADSRNATIRGMNRQGDVLGLIDKKVGNSTVHHMVIWHADGTREDVEGLGDPKGINAAGQVAGTRRLADRDEAFLYDHGTVIGLGGLGKGPSYARAINDAGWVVGAAWIRDEKHAFLWKDGVMHDLGTLGGKYAEATAINAQGHVAGYSTDVNEVQKAFFYDGTTMRALPPADGRQFVPTAINGHDEVVGCDSGMLPVYSIGDASYDLRKLLDDSFEPWDNLWCAVDINDAGQILGDGFYKPNIRTKYRVFLATPVAR